tara:strand:- start:111 stop:251 length:141 start_codon:yes stop_codon:yes gene_type:complete
MIYDGIARGRYNTISKKDLPLNELLLTTQAGKRPNKRAKKELKKIK